MRLLRDGVAILEANRTRAELYQLWLEEYDVDVAVTRAEAGERIDRETAVVVLNRQFADGAAPELLEVVRVRNPHCRVAVTRDADEGFPGIDPAYHLVKPVFEADLCDVVGRLVRQVNYRLALLEYYRTTGELAALEFVSDRSDPGDGGDSGDSGDSGDDSHPAGTNDPDSGTESADGRARLLERRVVRLRKLLAAYRERFDEGDVAAVMESISFGSVPDADDAGSGGSSKYQPDNCSNCGRVWDVTASGRTARGFAKLGAFVWRCVDCGQVQMQADPSHQRVSPYER